MSKPLSYQYTGTKGHIAAVASGLPKNPDASIVLTETPIYEAKTFCVIPALILISLISVFE